MTDNQLNNAASTRGRPFGPGNPGRRPGSRNKRAVLVEKLMADDAKAIAEAVIKAAKAGDMVAARLVLERIAPARKGRPVVLPMPPIRNAADIVDAFAALFDAMAAGDVTPDEASTIAGTLEARRKAIETQDIEARLQALEDQQQRKGPTQ
jgi:hypothetical protein